MLEIDTKPNPVERDSYLSVSSFERWSIFQSTHERLGVRLSW